MQGEGSDRMASTHPAMHCMWDIHGGMHSTVPPPSPCLALLSCEPAPCLFGCSMWAIQNFARPLRLSLAIALAPFFDRLIGRMSEATGLQKRWAFGALLAGMAVVTTTCLFGTIWALGGFPPAPAAS